MSTHSQHGRPSTYFMRTESDEVARIHLQDQFATIGMGGPLSEQADPTRFQRVLDVGCGTGGWLLSLAQSLPSTTRLVGIDNSEKMITYAQSRAAEKQVQDRIQFHVMDALGPLDFPEASFDLINQRFALGYIRTWQWSRMIAKFRKLCCPGGVIRLTEVEITQSTSPSLNTLCTLLMDAFYSAGNFFERAPNGVTSHLASLLQPYGLQDIATQSYLLSYPAYTPQGQRYAQDLQQAYQNMQPFLRKWAQVPANYTEIYQQALQDMQQPDFVATTNVVTCWGTLPLPSNTEKAQE